VPEEFFSEHIAPEATVPIDVAASMHSLIMDGTLAPGAKLRESELAAQFRVSRTPIREALVALEREGMVVYERNRGFSVRCFSLRDLRDAFEQRALLEGYACGLAAQRGLSADVTAALSNCLDEVGTLLAQERELDIDTLRQLREHNVWFHDRLLEVCDNPLFQRSHDMVQRLPRLPDAVASSAGVRLQNHRRYHGEHLRILDAVMARNSGRAEHLMREHILQGCEEIDRRIKALPSSSD
jgi:GntR family transcriptional regulator of vanillate catabolism